MKLKKLNRVKSRHTKVIFWLSAIVIVIVLGFGIRGAKNHLDHNAAVREEQADPQLQQQRLQRDHERQFMRTIASPAIRVYRKNYQILPSVVIAQAIVESDWGTAKLYRVANNPFGIKGQYHGKSVAYDTAEYIHGKRKTVSATFRKYPSLKAAVADHDQALNRGFIHKRHVMSYVTDAKLLQKNHYATDPNYAKKLVSVIRQYHLGRYDLRAINR